MPAPNQITIHEPLYCDVGEAGEHFTSLVVMVANCGTCSHTTADSGTCAECKPYQDVACLGCLKRGPVPTWEEPAEPPE